MIIKCDDSKCEMLIWFITCVCLSCGTTINGYLSIRKTYYGVSDVGYYNNYGSVSLFEHLVPEMTIKMSFSFKRVVSNEKCPPQDVVVLLQHGSYPIPENTDNKTFPGGFYLHRTSAYTVPLDTDGTIIQKDIISPVAGQWFGIAFIRQRDSNDVIQTLTNLDCSYHITINVTTIFLLNLPQIVHDTPHDLTFGNVGEYHIYRFFVETNVWRYDVIVEDCVTYGADTPCSVELSAASSALPNDENASVMKCDQNVKTSCVLTVNSPVIPKWHYLRVKAIADKKMNATLRVVLQGCSMMLSLSSHTVSKKSVSSDVFTESVTAATTTNSTEPTFTIADLNTTSSNCTTAVSMVTTTDATNETTHTPAAPSSSGLCGPINTLYRVEDMDSVNYAVYSLGPESVTQALVASHQRVALVQFNVISIRDSAGTLTFRALISEFAINLNSSQFVTVKMCLSRFRIPANNTQYYCPPVAATEILLDTGKDVSSVFTRYIPYPEPGPYFVGIQSYCYVLGNTSFGEPEKIYQPCMEEFTQVLFQIVNGPCVNTSCAGHGECRTYRKGSYIFSSCKCYAKYKGYSCEDDSEAESHSTQLLYTCLLSLSNLAFVPSIVVAVYRRYYVEAVVYFSNMFFSGFYHACDMHPWSIYTLCIMPYHVLSYCDFLLSIISFWVTLLAMAELPPVVVSVLHMVGVVAFAMGVEWAQHSMFLYIAPITIAVSLVGIMWVLHGVQIHKCYPEKRRWLYIIPGGLAAATGLIIFAFLENDDNYPYTHSVWHITIAGSIVFLLPQRQMQPCLGKDTDQSSDEFEFNDRHNIYHIQSDDSQLVDGDTLQFS